MQLSRPSAARFLPSLTDIVFLAPIVFLCGRVDGAKTLLGDGDTGWHIRAGEWILSNHGVPYTDMFSFTKPGQTWFAWEWLWDVVFSLLHRWGGMAAVLVASMAVISLTFALVYDTARKNSGNAVISAVVTLMAIMASSIHWLARPHLFTLLFCVLFYRALERGKPADLLVKLPLLMILWTNLHGGFVVGLILGGTYLAGEAWQAVFSPNPEKRSISRRRAALFAQSVGLCGAATLMNPYGYALHRHVFEYLTEGSQFVGIAEFQSLNFHHPLSRVVELLFLLGLGTALVSLVRGRVTHFLLLISWAHMALISTRNIPIYVIMAAPLIAPMLQELLSKISGERSGLRWPGIARRLQIFCSNMTAVETVPRYRAVSLAGFALFAALLLAPKPSERFSSVYNSHEYPERALENVQLAGSGRIFSTDVWGGYLIYRLYPQIRVFVDGRSDFYGPVFDKIYTDVMNVKPGWEAHLRQNGIQTVLLPADSPLSSAIKESRNWRCTYDDGIAIVFRPVNSNPGEDKQVSFAVAGDGRNRKAAATDRSRRSGNWLRSVLPGKQAGTCGACYLGGAAGFTKSQQQDIHVGRQGA